MVNGRPGDGLEIFHRNRKAVERGKDGAARDRRVLFPRLGHQRLPLAQSDDRVVARVERLGPIERRAHQLRAGNFTRRDHRRQFDGVEIQEIVGARIVTGLSGSGRLVHQFEVLCLRKAMTRCSAAFVGPSSRM